MTPAEKYEALELHIRDLKAQQDALKDAVLSEVVEDGGSIKTDDGAFSLIKRKAWTYSDAVKEKREILKSLEKLEQLDGTATCEIKTTFAYRKGKA